MERHEIPKDIRRILIHEMDQWLRRGQITPAQFEALRCLYDFDFQPPVVTAEAPAPPVIKLPATEPAIQPVRPVPPIQPKPRLTLAQTLLSETSIKIALYLGAFFVISAALILAALVAALRLPILIIVALLFGAGALVLKRRLPQPSFILYLVFSALLPITAGVLADLSNLSGKSLSNYWLFILLGMALLWAFSTYIYKSRLFSVAALLALDMALIMGGNLLAIPRLGVYLFLLSLCSLVGVGAAFLLKRWRGWQMVLPIFGLAQFQQVLIAGVACITIITPDQNLLTVGVFFLTGLLAILCNLLYPFVLYPWVAAVVLMPVAWLGVGYSLRNIVPSWDLFHPNRNVVVDATVFGVWGVIYTLAGNLLSRAKEQWRAYSLPASIAAIPLFLIGCLLGLSRVAWLSFGLSLGAAIVLTLAHVFYKRTWLWSLAIGFGLGAYLSLYHSYTYFSLTRWTSPHWCPWLAGATFLLLLPEILLPTKKLSTAWRWPLRGWAILTGIPTLFIGVYVHFLGTREQSTVALFTLGIVSLVYLAYGIRLRRAWLGILFSLHLTLAVVIGLIRYEVGPWLPILTCLAVLFFGCGVILKWLRLQGWSLIFRASGLALGGILSLAAFEYAGYYRVFYVTAIAALFLLETFRDTAWLEVIPGIIISLAYIMALHDSRVRTLAPYPTGIAGIFLILDLLYFRLKRFEDSWITRGLGFTAALLTLIMVVVPKFDPAFGAFACIGLAVIFLIQALLYRQALLGYTVTAFFTLGILFADLHFFSGRWLLSMIITAILFYGLSILLNHLKKVCFVLLFSGLGLATLTAISAPFERSGLIASLPVALAATLWAVEALRRRNVWLGFPANALYLMAYFMILTTLNVRQAQFYSVGAALLGMLMHYLLMRVGSKTGGFLMGMLSQLVLIGTTYIQFINTENIWYFAVMFFQSLIVIVYGIVIRSRSLVITPIILVIIGVMTVVFGALRGFSTVILIGMAGIGLIGLGIAALLLRERITNLRGLLKDWSA